MTSSSTKTAQTIDFKLCKYVSNRMLNKNASAFSNNSFILYWNNSMSFESVFRIKINQSRLFKKYLKRRKWRLKFCLSLNWVHINANKLLKTPFLLVQELINPAGTATLWHGRKWELCQRRKPTSLSDVIKTLSQRYSNVATTFNIWFLGNVTTDYSDFFLFIKTCESYQSAKWY